MPDREPHIDDYLRQQIKATTAKLYSTAPVETRIAAALRQAGRFHEDISAGELQLIMRNVVYVLFAQQRVVGLDVGLVHNVAEMNVAIDDSEARIDFIVHIHKPIVAFLEFAYTLENASNGEEGRLSLKEGTLRVNERTRRLDIKAKAALAALNVRRIAQQELGDPAAIIVKTLPPQLRRQGIGGELTHVRLALQDCYLNVLLEGEFAPLAADHHAD